MGLLIGQADINPVTPMPTDRVDDSSVANTASAETITWFYNNAGAWASATGQAKGTIIWGATTYDGVLNASKTTIGSGIQTSASLGAATRLSTMVAVPEDVFSRLEVLTPANQEVLISGYLTTQGDWAMDHRRGRVWGLPKDVVADDAITYSYKTPVSGGGSGDKVDIIKFGGTSVSIGQQASAGSIPVVLANDDDVEVHGDTAHDAVDSGNPVKLGGRARTTQMATVAEDDRTDAAFTTAGEQIMAGYSYTNQNNRISETDPVSEHHNEATLADITNGTDGTYYYYVDMDGYSSLGLQLTLSGGSGTCTVTVEGTIQDDGTAQASCVYTPETLGAYGVASFIATETLNDSQGYFGQFKYVRVKVVASTGGANDADWTIYSKRKY